MDSHLGEAQQGVQFLPLGAAVRGEKALLQLQSGGIARRQLLNNVHWQLFQHLIVLLLGLHHLGVLQLLLETLERRLRLLDYEVQEAALTPNRSRRGDEAVHVERRDVNVEARLNLLLALYLVQS
jgi:hypothetical protein